MKTYRFYIPSNYKEALYKLVNKYSRHLTINMNVSQPFEKCFRHANLSYDEMGHKVCGSQVMKHVVCDVEITVEDTFNWEILAEYNSGTLVFVGDHSKELEFSNPEHGANYTKCDCCKHKSYKSMFVLRNTETGEEVQIGPECAKTYGIHGLKHIVAFSNSLYEIFDFTACADGEEYGLYRCRFADTNMKKCVETDKVFDMVSEYYNECGGTWKSGYYSGNEYVRSESRNTLLNKVDKEYSEDTVLKNTELFNKVREYCETLVPGMYDEFTEGVKKSMTNKYISVEDIHFMFFAIKNYNKYLKSLENKFNVGDYVHVVGKIVSEKIYDGFYGMYTVYTILSENGNTFIRKGSVKSTGKDVNFYAKVEYVKADEFHLGPVTKNPKKGMDIMVG